MEKQRDWKQLTDFIDNIYFDFQKKLAGIFSIIYTDKGGSEVICKLLETSNNLSITVTGYDCENKIYNEFDYILSKMNSTPLSDILADIKSKASIFGEKNTRYLTAIAYNNAGDIDKAIEILDFITEDDEEALQICFSDLLIIRGNKNDLKRAEKLLLSLYSKSKLTEGLFPALFRLYQNDKINLNKYIMEALKYDPDNLATIEMYGTMLSYSGKNIEAAKEFRKLESFFNNGLYELIARINEIIAWSISSNKDIEKYIYEHINKYPSIKNEALLRLSNYFQQYKKSYFLEYKYLKAADIRYDANKVFEILLRKIEILKDEKIASKAIGKLKPYNKIKDAQKLNSERFCVLIECITILSSYHNGYLYWRD